MLSATAFLADGLDLVVEFLARSAADTTTISARYASYAELQQAAQALARWSCGLADAKALRSDAGGLSLSMPRGLWQDLYARALFSGMPTPPDRIGLSSLGAGGMLASLELVLERAECACAQQAIPWKSHPGLSMADGAPAPDLIAPETFVALEWQPLRDLLLRDAQLRQTVARMARFTGDPLVFAGAMPVEALLIEQSRRPALLICRAQWREAQLAALRQHFLEHALLLFRLLFLDKESGWGLDADSRLLPGFVELMAHSEEIGFLSFGDFADACAGMAGLQEFNPKLDLRAPLHDATRAMLELWPEPYLERNSALAPLYAGWMVQFHPSAHIAADAILEPGVRIRANAIVEAAAVVRAGACLGAGVRLPGGAIVGRNAHIARIELNGVRLPQGTVLHGDLLLHAGAWIRRHVEFGHGAEIGPGVVIREGVRVGARARIQRFFIGERVELSRGTLVEGNLEIGDDARIGADVRCGARVRIGAAAIIGDGIRLPPGVIVAPGARIDRLEQGAAAEFEPGVVLRGNAAIGRGAVVGAEAVLGADVQIGPDVHVPPGVEVEPGARIFALRLPGNVLPRASRLAGSLTIAERCRIGRGIRFGADVAIGEDVNLPSGVIVADGARIDALALHGARLPAGTTLEGNLYLGDDVRVGRAVRFGANVRVATGVALPDGVSIAAHARIFYLRIPRGALPHGARLHGSLGLCEGVVVGRGVEFHAGVSIACACAIPDALVFAQDARVQRFFIAPDVRLAPGAVVEGDLQLDSGVIVGARVRFGANVHVGRGVAIPAGAELAPGTRVTRLAIGTQVALPRRFTLDGDVSIGIGARIGEAVFLGAACAIGHGVCVPPGVCIAPGARVNRLRIAPDVALPANTQIGGDLVIGRGASVSDGVAFGADVRISPHVMLPPGVLILSGARLRELRAPPDALPPGTMLCGDLVVGEGAVIGRDVCFGAGVSVGAGARIASGITLPAGTRVAPGARIDMLDIGADVAWPALARIAGDLVVGAGASLGENLRLGAKVRIGAGAVIGQGASVGDGAVIGAGAVVAAGQEVPAGAHWQVAAPAGPEYMPCSDALDGSMSMEDGNVDYGVAWPDDAPIDADFEPSAATPVDHVPAPSEPLAVPGHQARAPRISPWRLYG